MANEKYKVLNIINHEEWLRGCPLFTVRSQIIFNNQTEKKYIVNEFANIGSKAIKSAVIKIECYDEENHNIGVIDNCTYQGLNVPSQAMFGGNKLFAIVEGTHTVSIIIKKIVFADDTTAVNDLLIRGIKVANPVKISVDDVVYDIVDARCKDSNIKPKFWPFQFDGGWRCTCAQLNDDHDFTCTQCGASKFWLLDNLNRDEIIEYKKNLETEMKIRIAREAEEKRLAAEREAEEKRLAAEREAEERRLAAEREAEERRLAILKAEEEARRIEEEKILAAEREEEERRMAIIRAEEEAKRIEAEKKAAEERARLELLMAKKEAVRQYNKQQTKKSVKKNFVALIIVVAIAVVAFGGYQLYLQIRVNDRYESAKQYVANYNYDEAIRVYKSLGNYKDSDTMVTQTKYEYAEYLTIINKYNDAIKLYTELGDYKDSAAMIKSVYAKWGSYCRENKDFQGAFEYYTLAGDAVESAVFLETSYENGLALMEAGQYEEAISMFESTSSIDGSATCIKQCYWLWGKMYLDQSRFDDAIEAFKNCYGYENTNELNRKAYYLKGNKLIAANDIEGAYNAYLNAGDYEDAQSKKESLKAELGMLKYEAGNYNAAYVILSTANVSDEETETINKTKYEYAEYLITSNITEDLLNIYKSLPENYEDTKKRIDLIEEYIEYLGSYDTDKEDANTPRVVVSARLVDGEVEVSANGIILDNKTFKADGCSVDNDGTLTFLNYDGNTYAYKK